MFAALGITLLIAGAVVLFAVDRSAEGFDLLAIGWILMAGGGLSLLIALIQAADSVPSRVAPANHREMVDASGRG